MVRSLLLVWLVGVVSFFALWAVLAKVIRKISEKKQKGETSKEEDEEMVP